MPIIVNLDVMLARRKISLTELSEKVGITMSNLSILKKGKAKAIRFSTLEAICEVLDCQPADILEYKPASGEWEKIALDKNSGSDGKGHDPNWSGSLYWTGYWIFTDINPAIFNGSI